MSVEPRGRRWRFDDLRWPQLLSRFSVHDRRALAPTASRDDHADHFTDSGDRRWGGPLTEGSLSDAPPRPSEPVETADDPSLDGPPHDTSDDAFRVGETIAGSAYRVLGITARGGQATLYEVENAIGRRLVVKALRPSWLRDDAEGTVRLEREAHLLARLDHPNIVRVFELRHTDDERRAPYLVLERLHGRDARSLLAERGYLPVSAALDLCADAAEALAYAHDHGVVHRDVKPENLFVHLEGNGRATTKLLDFGVARTLDGEAVTSGRDGSPLYASPELLAGAPPLPEDDVYALGLVLFEALAGERPYASREGTPEWEATRRTLEPPSIVAYREVPFGVEDIVARCLALRPDERFSEARALAEAVRALRTR